MKPSMVNGPAYSGLQPKPYQLNTETEAAYLDGSLMALRMGEEQERAEEAAFQDGFRAGLVTSVVITAIIVAAFYVMS